MATDQRWSATRTGRSASTASGLQPRHHWGRLLERSAPQSGWGISRYQYDNNTAIHLVNLETSSPHSRSSVERAPQGKQVTYGLPHTSLSIHFLKRVTSIIHIQFHTGFALSGVGWGRRGDPAGCRRNSWAPYSVNTKDAPLPAQSSIACTVTGGITESSMLPALTAPLITLVKKTPSGTPVLKVNLSLGSTSCCPGRWICAVSPPTRVSSLCLECAAGEAVEMSLRRWGWGLRRGNCNKPIRFLRGLFSALPCPPVFIWKEGRFRQHKLLAAHLDNHKTPGAEPILAQGPSGSKWPSWQDTLPSPTHKDPCLSSSPTHLTPALTSLWQNRQPNRLWKYKRDSCPLYFCCKRNRQIHLKMGHPEAQETHWDFMSPKL